jgi:hypothetical protein
VPREAGLWPREEKGHVAGKSSWFALPGSGGKKIL